MLTINRIKYTVCAFLVKNYHNILLQCKTSSEILKEVESKILFNLYIQKQLYNKNYTMVVTIIKIKN